MMSHEFIQPGEHLANHVLLQLHFLCQTPPQNIGHDRESLNVMKFCLHQFCNNTPLTNHMRETSSNQIHKY